MGLLLRSLSRLAALCLCGALAIAGLALGIFAIGGDGTVSLPALARDLHLPGLLDAVGERLRRLELGERRVAWPTLLGGAAAIVLGLTLLIGALLPRRERLFILEQSEQSRLAARRQPLAQLVATLAQQARGVTQAKVRLRPRRRGLGGRLMISASRSMTASDAEAVESTTQAIAPVTEPFALRTQVRARAGTGHRRVA
jgi:hypothetical protein